MIEFCDLCNHWFCGKCRRSIFWRGLEAVKEFVGGPREGCCDSDTCHVCNMRKKHG